MDDLLSVCFGNDYIQNSLKDEELLQKYEVISNYIHPISYKLMAWKNDSKPNSGSNRKILQKKPNY